MNIDIAGAVLYVNTIIQQERKKMDDATLQQAATRFFQKVRKAAPLECWEWQASKSAFGYGLFVINGKNVGAHRVSFALTHGVAALEKKRGFVVRHDCDNPICVNPAHLRIGTPFQNRQDCVNRNRAKFGEDMPGSKLTVEAVRDIRSQPLTIERAAELMVKYQVHESTILQAFSRKAWKQVE